MKKPRLNALQLAALKDVLKRQQIKTTAPRSEQKGYSDTPLFMKDNQEKLF